MILTVGFCVLLIIFRGLLWTNTQNIFQRLSETLVQWICFTIYSNIYDWLKNICEYKMLRLFKMGWTFLPYGGWFYFFLCDSALIDNYIPFSVGHNCSLIPLFHRQFSHNGMFNYFLFFNLGAISCLRLQLDDGYAHLLQVLGEGLCICIFLTVIFIRPFEKRDVLCRGNVRPSVCPSVRPSVRPSAFSGLFFNMLWDINLKLGICIQ